MAYISNKLTHWVGSKKTKEEQYNILTQNILKEKMLLFGSPFWSLSQEYPEFKAQGFPMISLTDIPLSESELLCSRYSKFGISFNKTYLVNCHATPVGYIQNPAIPGNIRFILKAFEALKRKLDEKGIKEWHFDGFRPNGKEIATVDSIQGLLLYIFSFTEKYSKDKEFRYSKGQIHALPGQEKFFEDPNALYFEREWRILLNTLLKQELKDYIVEREKDVYFKFDEKYVECIIIPKECMSQFAKQKKSIFSHYNEENIPPVIAYEDLKYF